MTVKNIQQALQSRFSNHKYDLCNSYIFKHDWECDFFSVTNNAYCYEIEIKLSRSDYLADFKKYKHKLFENIKKPLWVMNSGGTQVHYGYEKKQVPVQSRAGVFMTWKSTALYADATRINIIDNDKLICPNKFYYAVPEGLIKPDEVPKYAGLIYVKDLYSMATIVKPAPFLHKRKLELQKILLDKFYYECKTLRQYLKYKSYDQTATN